MTMEASPDEAGEVGSRAQVRKMHDYGSHDRPFRATLS